MMTETVVTVEPSRPAAQPKPNNGLGSVQINFAHFTTIPGIIKLVQIILGIICMALAAPGHGAGHFFLFVVVTSFIATILWCFVYILSIREVLNLSINWILTELINTAIISIIYLIAFIAQLSYWSGWYGAGAQIAAGVFGIFNFIAYVAGAYFLYIEFRASATT